MVGPNSMITSKPTSLKFLCSYGGKILPRYPDGKLRYFSGETRLLSVDRSTPLSELLSKMAELHGSAVSLRCQLPSEDLDSLVSVTSDEDLANLIEEYDRSASASASGSLKIRAFLSPPKSAVKRTVVSPPSSSASSSSPRSPPTNLLTPEMIDHRDPRCLRQMAPPPRKVAYCAYHNGHRNNAQNYLINNGNHWH